MQPSDFSVQLREGTEARSALVILGAPGLGLVGAIATRYLVNQLKMQLVGGVYSTRLPPTVGVRGGGIVPQIGIYATEPRGRFGFDAERLVVIHTEAELPEEWLQELAHALAAWAKGSKCKILAVVDGILVPDESSDDVVLAVATLPEGARALEQLGVSALAAGTVGGIAGALLQAGTRAGLNVVALLAETKPTHPDAGAAARIVQILDGMVPAIKIEIEPLLKEAELIEAKVREAQSKASARSVRTDTMYR